MADSGKNASFKFTTVLFDADDCLQGWNLGNAINDVVYQCNGYDKHAIGTHAATFRVSLAMAATDTTKMTLLAPGTTGAFEAHPAGDTPGYLEIEVARAEIISSNISTSANAIILADVEFGLDDIDIGAATS